MVAVSMVNAELPTSYNTHFFSKLVIFIGTRLLLVSLFQHPIQWGIIPFRKRPRAQPDTGPYYASAAGRGVIPAATAAAATAMVAAAVIPAAIVAAAAPNDDQQNDDPAAIATAKTTITHTETS